MRKPPHKPIPREKILKKMHFMRKMTAFMDKRMAGSIVGKERILPTEKGNVRTLTYGFENPETQPVLVDIHGGGFVMGNPEMDDPFMMQFVEKCGVKVISIDYTLSPDVMFPVALEECHAVIRYLKEHQEELNIDGDRIVIMGHSAGGNFCAAIGLMDNGEQKLGLKGILLDYPPTDILTDPFDKPLPKGCLPPNVCRMFNAAYCTPEEAKNPLVSPTFATAEMVNNFPPTLVITAGKDSLAGETEVFKDTLISAGVDVTFKRFEGVIHGFTITPPAKAKKQPKEYEASLEAWQMMIDFVNRVI